MNLLLDSHILLWALHAPERMSAGAFNAIRDTRNGVFYSAASVWELEIKAAKGKLSLPDDWLAVAERTGFIGISVDSNVAKGSARLPWHHSDPFDRLLVAQAAQSSLRLVTRDAWIARYGVAVLEG